MSPRIQYGTQAPEVYEAMGALDDAIQNNGLDRVVVYLVQLRVSQINGCAYCLDLHWKDLKAQGVSDQRLYSLPAWRESPWYSPRERAALTWAEAVTDLGSRIPDGAFEAVRGEFSEAEVARLTLVVAGINAWNRLSIAARLTPPEARPDQGA
jgi:AhpD family alkylhydroperoxidase